MVKKQLRRVRAASAGARSRGAAYCVALDPGSSLPRIKCGVARPGHAVLVSRASAASATARAKRDPGPSGRSAQYNIGSHRGRYAVAAAASPRVIELMQDRGEGVGLLSDPAAVGRGVG